MKKLFNICSTLQKYRTTHYIYAHTLQDSQRKWWTEHTYIHTIQRQNWCNSLQFTVVFVTFTAQQRSPCLSQIMSDETTTRRRPLVRPKALHQDEKWTLHFYCIFFYSTMLKTPLHIAAAQTVLWWVRHDFIRALRDRRSTVFNLSAAQNIIVLPQ